MIFFFFNYIFFSGCCRPTDRFSVLITVQGWGEPSHRQRFDREISAPLPPPRGHAPGPYPGSSVPPLPPQFPLTPRAREGAGRDRNLPGAALHTEVSRGRPLGLTRPTLVRGPGLPSWVGGAPPSPPPQPQPRPGAFLAPPGTVRREMVPRWKVAGGLRGGTTPPQYSHCQQHPAPPSPPHYCTLPHAPRLWDRLAAVCVCLGGCCGAAPSRQGAGRAHIIHVPALYLETEELSKAAEIGDRVQDPCARR